MLNKGQQEAKALIDEGYNVCISGEAGCGKSFLMGTIITKNTIVCAPTGSAALLVGGMTNHSLFNLPIGVCLESDRFKTSKKLEELFANQKVDRIIMDEVSQCRADQLSLIDQRLRKVTQKDIPFGGVQMVFVGDFFQLPPIVSKDEQKVFYETYSSPWAFDSMSWKMADVRTYMLTEVMRQEDILQKKLLTSIRKKDSDWIDSVNMLNEISSPTPLDGIHLASYNKTVDMINNTRYKEIEGEEIIFQSINKGFSFKDMPVENAIRLKIGCRVLIKANNPEGGYVNGTTGTVVGFEDGGVHVKTFSGDEVFVDPFEWTKYEYTMGVGGLERNKIASFKQIPIKLGWAISIHSSQGCTLERVNVDFGRGAFSAGQAYVALSRVKDLSQMHIVSGLDYSDIIVDTKVKDFYKGV